MSDRIEELEIRVEQLESRVRALEPKQEQVKPAPPPMKDRTPVNLVEKMNQNPDPYFYKDPEQEEMPAGGPRTPSTPTFTGQVPPARDPLFKREKGGLEAFIGKNLMGILASVLVFISLIMFAILVIPKLTVAIKIIAMYVFSFGLTGISLYTLKKRDNALLLSLSGCGVGAVFISLFVTHLYFRVIGMIPLYCLLLLWAVGTLYLSKKFSWLFHVIGEVGIYISCLLGMNYLGKMPADALLVGMLVFYVIGSGIFLFPKKETKRDSYISYGFQMVSLCTMNFMLKIYSESSVTHMASALTHGQLVVIAHLILIAYTIILVAYHVHHIALEPAEVEFGFGFGYTLNLLYTLYNIYTWTLTLDIIWALLGVFLYGLLTVICSKTFIAKDIWRCSMLVLAIVSTCHMCEEGGFYGIVSLIVMTAIALGYGFLVNDRFTQVVGFILYGIGCLITKTVSVGKLAFARDVVYLVCWLGIGLCVYLWMNKHRETYSTGLKNANHVILCIVLAFGLWTFLLFGMEWNVTVQWLMVSGYNILVMKTPFSRNWITGHEEPPTKVTTNILNVLFIVEGLVLIANNNDNVIVQMIAIVFTVVLCSLNTLAQLQSVIFSSKYALLPEIYVGGKYLFLLYYILVQVDAADYVADIVVLLFAIICIVLGFIAGKKGLRVFGLGLSIIAMVKLILIDIHYDNSAGRAASFLMCGVLCFVISAIYTYVDKKMKVESSKGDSYTV